MWTRSPALFSEIVLRFMSHQLTCVQLSEPPRCLHLYFSWALPVCCCWASWVESKSLRTDGFLGHDFLIRIIQSSCRRRSCFHRIHFLDTGVIYTSDQAWRSEICGCDVSTPSARSFWTLRRLNVDVFTMVLNLHSVPCVDRSSKSLWSSQTLSDGHTWLRNTG